jgi:hypothetical protein
MKEGKCDFHLVMLPAKQHIRISQGNTEDRVYCNGPQQKIFKLRIKKEDNIYKYTKKKFSRLCIGLSVGSVQKGTCLGRTSNTYAMQDDKCDYCLICGEARFLEWPLGAVKPKWTGTGCEDVFGCGLVLSPDNKLAIFFTTNGILMGKLSYIMAYGGIVKNGG